MFRLLTVVFLCTYAGSASNVFILPAAKAPAALHQCTRDTPQGVEGFWTPSTSQIAALERNLATFIETRPSERHGIVFAPRALPSDGHHTVVALDQYRRQYVGFIKGGKRYVYGNFYMSSRAPKDEASQAVSVCDGGWAYWGITYSVESGEFNDLQLNWVG